MSGKERRIALSIDLDYFNEFPPEHMDKCFRRVLRCKVPLVIVNDHQHLAPFFCENSNYDTLINMDYHSDLMSIIDSPLEGRHCGNWLSYVPYENRNYVWLTPDRHGMNPDRDGCCDGTRDFWKPEGAPYRYWKDINVTQQERCIKWNSVTSVGISLSSHDDYTNPEVLDYFFSKWYNPIVKKWTVVHASGEPVSRIYLEYIRHLLIKHRIFERDGWSLDTNLE